MDFTQLAQAVQESVAQVIVGKRDVVELLLRRCCSRGTCCWKMCRALARRPWCKALARSLGVRFKRIQCTPDLLPSDVTGTSILQPARAASLNFVPGPVFAQVLLGDEINRATPRTQSSLLEAMARAPGDAGRPDPTHCPGRFMVIATQNPIEYEGTFPLPEAQLDRFLMQLRLGYPDEAEEEQILLRYEREDPLDDLKPVATVPEILALQQRARQIHVSADVRRYILRVVRATRDHQSVVLGVSPRGTLALYKAGQALAALRGRDFVIPSDVQHLCPAVLTHRVHISPQIRLRGRVPAEVIAEVTDAVPVPVVQ